MNRRAMKKPNLLLAAVAMLAMLPLAACGGAPAEPPPLAGAQIGGPFTLTDKDGKTVRWDDFAGKWRIVYFGYTYCPDACPTDVGVMMRGFDAFAAAHPDLARDVQPIFISIDPARDTPARVGEFAAAFSPRLLGLTGTPEQIDQAAKAFIAYYARGKDTPGGGYLMDHSRIAVLMDRAGKPIAMLPVDKGPRDGPPAVAAELTKWVQ
ncbi:MAG: SCO family protein [Sphingomonadales bacterium]|nr:SCO family protein [Sphingomonadales bacterium]MBU3993471.1 SCO family protein [Alphaproteobacteria bacterium]